MAFKAFNISAVYVSLKVGVRKCHFFTTSRTAPHLLPCPPPSSLSPHHLLPKKGLSLIGIRCTMLCGTIFASIMCVALYLLYLGSHLALIQDHKTQTLLSSLALAAHIFTPFGPRGESPFLYSTRSTITKGLQPFQLPCLTLQPLGIP